MVELDHAELTATYQVLRKMELALLGAGFSGGIKSTNKLNVLIFKKAMQSLDADE